MDETRLRHIIREELGRLLRTLEKDARNRYLDEADPLMESAFLAIGVVANNGAMALPHKSSCESQNGHTYAPCTCPRGYSEESP